MTRRLLKTRLVATMALAASFPAAAYGSQTSSGAGAQTKSVTSVTEHQKIPGPGPDDNFGISLALSERLMVVGASSHEKAGAVFVFRRQRSGPWQLGQKLKAPDPHDNDQYGSALALQGDTLVVAEWLDDDRAENAGAAFVYRLQNGRFVQAQKLYAPEPQSQGYFGNMSVGVSSRVLAIGASRRPQDPEAAGVVYLYTPAAGGQWTFFQEIAAPEPKYNDVFGIAIAVSDDVVVVGANHDDDRGENSGSAYVFTRPVRTGKWTLAQKLLAEDGAASDYFGEAVATNGETIAVGATWANVQVDDCGAVYVYERTQGASWRFAQKLVAPDASKKTGFGRGLAVLGGTLLIGAHYDQDVGAAYLLRRSPKTRRWEHAQKLVGADPSYGGELGIAVGLSAEQAAAGAPIYGPDAVYVFELPR